MGKLFIDKNEPEEIKSKFPEAEIVGFCPYSAVQHKCGLVKPPAKVCRACLLEMKEGGKINV